MKERLRMTDNPSRQTGSGWCPKKPREGNVPVRRDLKIELNAADRSNEMKTPNLLLSFTTEEL